MRTLTIFFAFIIFQGCEQFPPFSKSEYFNRFEKFLQEVEANGKNYDELDWQKSDEIYFQYSKEWYKKFNASFTDQDKSIYKKKCLKYHAIKLQLSGQKLGEKLERMLFELENSLIH